MTTRRRPPGEVAKRAQVAGVAQPSRSWRSRRAGEGLVDNGSAPRAREPLSRQRAERSRRCIAEALIELVAEQSHLPTALDIASRAGVSLRLIFHHFGDVDAVYEKALELQAAEWWAPVVPAAPGIPLPRRVDETVRQRAELFEAVEPLRRAAVMLAVRRLEVARALAEGDVMSRAWLEITFSPELRVAGRQRSDLLGSMELVTSWEAWTRLRRAQGLSISAARRLMGRSLAGIVGSARQEEA